MVCLQAMVTDWLLLFATKKKSVKRENRRRDYAFGIQTYLSETLHVVLSLLPLGYLILQSVKTGKISVWV